MRKLFTWKWSGVNSKEIKEAEAGENKTLDVAKQSSKLDSNLTVSPSFTTTLFPPGMANGARARAASFASSVAGSIEEYFNYNEPMIYVPDGDVIPYASIQMTPLPPGGMSITISATLKLIALTGGMMIMSRIISSLGGFVSSIMISKSISDDLQLQEDIVAAGALIGNFQRLTLAIVSVSLTFYGNKIGSVDKNMDEKLRKEDIGRIYRQSLLVSCLLWIPPFLILYFSGSFLKLIGQPKRPSELCEEYFRSYSWGIIPQLFMYNQQNLLINIKKPGQVFLSSFVYTVLSVGFSYQLIFKNDYGYKGLGWASTFAYFIIVPVLFLWTFCSEAFKDYNFYKISRDAIPSSEELIEFFKEGGSHSLQITIDLVVNLIMTIQIGFIGGADLFAAQVAFQYLYLLLIPIANAVNTISYAVSQQASNPKNASRLRNITLGFSVIIPAIMLIFSLIFPKDLISPFVEKNSEPTDETIALTESLLWCTNAVLCFYLPRLTQGAYMRGLNEDAGKALKATIASNSIALGVGSLLCYLALGTKGFFFAKIIGEGVATSWLMVQSPSLPMLKGLPNKAFSIFCPCLSKKVGDEIDVSTSYGALTS